MPTFKLTKAHVFAAFEPLAEIEDLTVRNRFFSEYVVPDVIWTMTGSAHSLIGTRTTLQAHSDATFNRLGKKLVKPIKFIVLRAIVDGERSEDGWWASVETKGEATRKNGKPYDNEYVWLTRWNDEGKMVEIRSYFDTMLSEQVLEDPE